MLGYLGVVALVLVVNCSFCLEDKHHFFAGDKDQYTKNRTYEVWPETKEAVESIKKFQSETEGMGYEFLDNPTEVYGWVHIFTPPHLIRKLELFINSINLTYGFEIEGEKLEFPYIDENTTLIDI